MLMKKDFKAIAEIIGKQTELLTGDTYDYGYTDAAKHIANELAYYFATQNPCFDRERFMKACGL